MSFVSTSLYGGAITVDLPTTFRDTSLIREVPDHQEVYLDSNGYTSVIFEVLEYVDQPSDEAALQYHFGDLVEGTGDSTTLLQQGTAVVKNLPTHPVQSLSFTQTPAPPAPEQSSRKAPAFVAITLLLLRLKEQKTDMLITVNVPHYKGVYVEASEGEGGVTQLMREEEAIAERVLDTLQIKDWGLFQD